MIELKNKQQLYFIEFYHGLSGASECEKFISNKVDCFEHKLVTENAKKLILATIIDLHDEFFEKNKRVRKDRDFEYKFTPMQGFLKGDYEVIFLSERGECTALRFYPKNILDYDVEKRDFVEIKTKGVNHGIHQKRSQTTVNKLQSLLL